MGSVEAEKTGRHTVSLVRGQFLALGLLMGCWATSLPGLKQRFGYSDQEFALVLLALAMGSAGAFLSCARLMRVVGSAHFTRGAGVLAAIAVVATFVETGTVSLVLTAVVIGFASAGFDVAINSSAVALERVRRRPIMSQLHAMFSTGGVVAAGGAAVLFLSGWPLLWLAIVAAVLMALSALAAVAPPLPATGGLLAGASVLNNPLLLRLGAAALLCLLCEGVMYDWSAVYMVHAFEASMAVSVAGFGLFSAAMALGRFTGDGLRQRFGESTVLVVGCLLAAGGALAAVVGGQRELALVGFVLVGLGLSNVIPIVFAQAPRAHAGAPEQAIAMVSGIGFTGFLVGPPIVGLWSAVFSLDTSLLLVFGACLGVTLLTAGRGRCDDTR